MVLWRVQGTDAFIGLFIIGVQRCSCMGGHAAPLLNTVVVFERVGNYMLGRTSDKHAALELHPTNQQPSASPIHRPAAYIRTGLLVFIPGAYVLRHAYLVYTARGSWEDIPDFGRTSTF